MNSVRQRISIDFLETVISGLCSAYDQVHHPLFLEGGQGGGKDDDCYFD